MRRVKICSNSSGREKMSSLKEAAAIASKGGMGRWLGRAGEALSVPQGGSGISM